MKGIVILDKPAGITSFGVVARIRRKLKVKKVGHCGTLDPLATGLLVILLGESTKLFPRFSSFDKAYEATLELGISTSTGDCQGKVLKRQAIGSLSELDAIKAFNEFKGRILQMPPMFSALKYQGRKLYEFARKGIEIPRKEREVTIHELRIDNFNIPYVDFFMHCSKGTYVRAFAQDIGERIGCGACIVKIRRVGIGPFNINDAITLDKFNESHIRTWQS